jgi:hypothetical protein
MSGDNIESLKMVKEQPLNLADLEYTEKLIEPFEDIVIERFNVPVNLTASASCTKKNIFVFIAVGLVLFINFPKIKEKSGFNEYLLWLISAILLIGIIY